MQNIKIWTILKCNEVIKINMKITHLNCHWNLPGVNELSQFQLRWYPEPVMTQFSDTHVHHYVLTHCAPVMPYGNIDLDQHWLR